jgi:hypothetical protein
MRSKNDPAIVQVIDQEDSGYFVGIQITTRQHANSTFRRKIIELPRSTIHDAQKLIARLVDAGAVLPPAQNKQSLARAIRQSERTAKVFTRVKELGWRSNEREFVSFWGLTTETVDDENILPPCSDLYAGTKKFLKARRWREDVAKPAARSSAMVLSLCASFAAATLKLCEVSPFALIFLGRSKSGKSAAQVVGSSVCGFLQENALPNFHRTEAALGELLVAFNDHPLFVNELELLKGSVEARRETLRSLAYALGEGRGKSFAKSTGRESSNFRTILVGSAEQDLAPSTILSGASARLVFVPASRSEDNDIFDNRPTDLSKDELANWTKHQFLRIRKGCGRYGGSSFSLFTRQVASDKERAKRLLLKYSSDMATRLTKHVDDPIVCHVAGYFAHVAASGMLAANFKLLPFKRNLIRRAVTECFNRTVDTLPTAQNVLKEGRARIESFLAASGTRGKYITHATPVFWERRNGKRVITVRGEDLKRELGGADAAVSFLKAADSLGLVLSGNRKLVRKCRVVDFESQITWPTRERVRSLELIFNLQEAQRE